MNEGKISVRYAQALYALAEEKGLQKDIYECMEQLSQAFMQVAGFATSLSNPMHSQPEKMELLIAASSSKRVGLLADFFNLVLSKGREEYMVFMAMSYQKIYREKERVILGNIVSAAPLQSNSVDKIRQLVDQQFHASIELTTEVNPEILGGFILEVDNYLMDSSVRTELENVRTELLRV